VEVAADEVESGSRDEPLDRAAVLSSCAVVGIADNIPDDTKVMKVLGTSDELGLSSKDKLLDWVATLSSCVIDGIAGDIPVLNKLEAGSLI
jgi:hypothetical protein